MIVRIISCFVYIHACYFVLCYCFTYYYYSKRLLFSIQKFIIIQENTGEKYRGKIQQPKNPRVKLVPMCVSASVLGMRLHHITATLTRLLRLPLLSHPPATSWVAVCMHNVIMEKVSCQPCSNSWWLAGRHGWLYQAHCHGNPQLRAELRGR